MLHASQGNAAEDAANDELAESAAAALIAGRTISANAKKALEERVARNSTGSVLPGDDGGLSPQGKRLFTPDDEVLFRDVSHHPNLVNRVVGTGVTMSRVESDEPAFGDSANPLHGGGDDGLKDAKKKKKKDKKK